MQELSRSVQQRIKKTKQVVEQGFNSQTIRHLREQQKIRCEKQSFILSMMRSNKVMSSPLKKYKFIQTRLYYKNSFELMKLLEVSFQFKPSLMLEDDFLNDFVHLYTAFFSHFQNKFTFKTKIKNFLRPTNHNLIVDLIKYFVDFTRDYYVQTLFWKMKTSFTKYQQQTALQEQVLISTDITQEMCTKSKPSRLMARNFSTPTDTPDNNTTSPRKKTDEGEQKKNNHKNYQILQISLPALTINMNKQNQLSLESLKMKINELFRDQKSRNSSIKQIYQNYFESYNQKFNKGWNLQPQFYNSFYNRADQINKRVYPYKMILSVERNSVPVILVQLDNKKTRNSYFASNNKMLAYSNTTSNSNSPLKSNQNSLSPLKISQRISQGDQSFKSDYFLTSMKVLRVSQNFLPPLFTSNMMMNSLVSSKKQLYQKQSKDQNKKNQKRSLLPFSIKLKKMTDQIQEAVPFSNQVTSSSNVLVRSTSYKKSTIEKQKKRLQVYNNQIYSAGYIMQRKDSQQKRKRKQSQDLTQKVSNKKLNLKKKMFSQQRKSYQGGTYMGNFGNKKHNTQMTQQSQQKILQWLQRIKNLKDIQRKKIMGMNF